MSKYGDRNKGRKNGSIPPGAVDLTPKSPQEKAAIDLEACRLLRAALKRDLDEVSNLLDGKDDVGQGLDSDIFETLNLYRGALQNGLRMLRPAHALALVRCVKMTLAKHEKALENVHKALIQGQEENSPPKECTTCGGSGNVSAASQDTLGVMHGRVACPTCQGKKP